MEEQNSRQTPEASPDTQAQEIQQSPYPNPQQQIPYQNPQQQNLGQQNFYQNPQQQAPYQNSNQQSQPNSWMHDSRLSGIDPAKLQALMAMAGQGAGKSQNELASFLMAAASKSRERGMTFSPQETDLIIDAMKQGRSPEEVAKIDRIRMMMRLLK